MSGKFELSIITNGTYLPFDIPNDKGIPPITNFVSVESISEDKKRNNGLFLPFSFSNFIFVVPKCFKDIIPNIVQVFLLYIYNLL